MKRRPNLRGTVHLLAIPVGVVVGTVATFNPWLWNLAPYVVFIPFAWWLAGLLPKPRNAANWQDWRGGQW